MDGTRFGVGIRMVGANDRVKLAQHQHLGTLAPCVEHGIKSGNALGKGELVSELLELLCKVPRGLYLAIARFGVAPNMTFGFKDQVAVLFNGFF